MGDAGTMSVAAQDTLTGAGVQTITGAKTFNDQKLLMRNPAGTFSLTQRSPAITLDRSILSSLVPYHWDVLVWKDTPNSKVLAFTKDGTIISDRTAGSAGDDLCIFDAVQATPAQGTLLIMPGSYTVGTNALPIIPTAQNANSEILFSNDMTVFAYGATLTANAAVPHLATHLLKPAIGKSVAIYGMTLDINKSYAVGFGTNVNNDTARLAFIDGKIKNVYSYGIITGNHNDVVNDNAELYCENITVDAGDGTAISNNECIAARCNGRITIKNAVLLGNKAMHPSSRYITLDNVWCDGSAWSGISEMSPVNGEFIDCRNIYMKDLGLSLRPFLSMDGQTPFTNCRQATVDGYCGVESSGLYHNIQVSGYDGLQIENCTISNFNISRAPVAMQPHAQATTGTVKNLTIENGYINGVTSSHRILSSYNVSVENLTIRNVKIGSYSTATEAPIWLQTSISSKNADVTIGKCTIENIIPESTQYIVRAGDNGSGVAKAVSITFERPLGNNSQQFITSGAATLAVKFRENSGKATFSGNASTKVFNIPHILSAAPSANSINVTVGSADAAGDFVITSDATNIIVTYPVAPPTGTNNIILYWRARAG